jgi:predicted DNA binding CopG/RHH family protein
MTDKKSRIPEFQSVEEEAEFWDTHSFADYWSEMKPVKVRFAKKLSDTLTIRLDTKSIEEIRELASEQGIGPTTLARMWLLKQIKKEKSNQSANM